MVWCYGSGDLKLTGSDRPRPSLPMSIIFAGGMASKLSSEPSLKARMGVEWSKTIEIHQKSTELDIWRMLFMGGCGYACWRREGATDGACRTSLHKPLALWRTDLAVNGL